MPVGLFTSKINQLTSVMLNSASPITSPSTSSSDATLTPTASILFTENNICVNNQDSKSEENLISSTTATLAKENETHLIVVNAPLININKNCFAQNDYSSVAATTTTSKYLTKQLKFNSETTTSLDQVQVCENTSQTNQQHILFDYSKISDEMSKQQQTFLDENLTNSTNSAQNFVLAGNRLNFNLALLASSDEQIANSNARRNYKLINQNRLLLFNQHENYNEKQKIEIKENNNEYDNILKNDQNNYSKEKIDNFRINLINNSNSVSNESNETSSSSSATNIQPPLIFSSSNPIMFETSSNNKAEENISNYLKKINNENNDHNNNNEDKNSKIILDENSILIDKNSNTNTANSKSLQMQKQPSNSNNSIKSSSAQFISIAPFSSNNNEYKQNSNSNLVQFVNDEQNNFNLIIIDTSNTSNNSTTQTKISNSIMSSANSSSQIKNKSTNQEFDFENLLIQTPNQIGLELNQSENDLSINPASSNKNNIDHAIDAVLSKCYSTSNTTNSESTIRSPFASTNTTSVEVEDEANKLTDENHLVKLEDSTNSSKSKKVIKKRATNKTNNNHSSTKQIENKIPTNSSTTTTTTCVSNVPSTSLMSKSSKARTSYISSLIANREKSKDDDHCQHHLNQNSQLLVEKQHTQVSLDDNPIQNAIQCHADDKHKRILQNSLSILPTNTNNTTLSNGENKRSDQFSEKSNYFLTGFNLTKTSPNQHQQQTELYKLTNSEYSDLVNILNEHKIGLVNRPKAFVKTHLTSDIDFILNNNDLNNPNKNHSTSPTNNTPNTTTCNLNNAPTFLECTHLKRVLGYTIAQDSCISLGIDEEYQMDSSSLENVLMNSSFDNIQITVQNVADVAKMPFTSLTVENLQPRHELVTQPQQVKNEFKETTKTTIKRKQSLDQNKSALAPKASKKRAIKTDDQTGEATPEKSVLKVKKLKTIADIVKHNSTQQQLQQQQQLELKQEILIRPKLLETSDLTLTWLNQNTKNESLTSQSQLDNNSSYYTSPHYILTSNETNSNPKRSNNNATSTSQLDMDQIDNLLELEFNNVTANGTNQQAIDKYIDLDDIDVNPLISTNIPCSSASGNAATSANTHLDEFNFQFSVCSSTSSGYSEPSNFSTNSTSSISNNSFSSFNGVNTTSSGSNNNSTNIFLSESESSPYQYDTCYQQQHSFTTNFNSNNNSNLTDKKQSIMVKNNQYNDIAEIAKKLKSTRNSLLNESILNNGNTNTLLLINNNCNQQQPLIQCINNEPNFIGNFSFFTDEIGAGVN